MNPAPPDPGHRGLIFDWKHRPRTWARLTTWLLLVLLAHLAGFVLFSVRTPLPARGMPVPSSIVLAADRIAGPSDPAGTAAAGLLLPAETADLDLPEHNPTDPHLPTFADHVIARQGWPARPERGAWPEVSNVSQPVLPPVRPSPEPPGPAAAPR